MKIIKDILQRNSYARRIFAIREGVYKGCFFVYISSSETDYNFLQLPEIDVVTVPKKDFEDGIENKIVDYIKKLPHNVYEICCAQYNEAKARSDINRLKQSATQDRVDRRKRKNKR